MSKRFKKSFKILLVGAGNIGSRHLQALKAVKIPLKILVVDPSSKSLKLAEDRYDSAPTGKFSHEVAYHEEISKEDTVDLAIITTCSDIRAEITRKLFKKTRVRFLVLEKLLFSKKNDYDSIGKLIKRTGTKTWVNCPMRMMPAFNSLQKEFSGRRILYNATLSGDGLITNAIHYLDHMVFLTGSDDFTINTDGLDRKTVPSKRSGFLEYTGTLRVLFKNGSVGNMICFRKGGVPILIQFYCDQAMSVVKEKESKAWVSR
ncbi:MAG: Gfo/Idh/MocA family oxidoreductase, partial [Candidatus Yanofskybacteria bacterium]|nr:Gfo/Idh/MocA family oxidoreductase [Candidatus Yanofskybacteria bacterium]